MGEITYIDMSAIAQKRLRAAARRRVMREVKICLFIAGVFVAAMSVVILW